MMSWILYLCDCNAREVQNIDCNYQYVYVYNDLASRPHDGKYLNIKPLPLPPPLSLSLSLSRSLSSQLCSQLGMMFKLSFHPHIICTSYSLGDDKMPLQRDQMVVCNKENKENTHPFFFSSSNIQYATETKTVKPHTELEHNSQGRAPPRSQTFHTTSRHCPSAPSAQSKGTEGTHC